MLRLLLAYSLIALVLACPYQCIAGMVRVAGEPQATTACQCCHRSQPNEDPASPAPAEDSSPHACLCQGATIDAPRGMAADFDLQLDALVPQVCVTSDRLSLQLIASTAHEPPTQALAPSGWDICVLQCAMLL